MLQNEGELGKSLPTYIHQKTIDLLLLVILGSWSGGVHPISVVGGLSVDAIVIVV